ncbi:UNVERIFIED_CONTAM: hypothetical protein Sindi_1845300 [Sesamum indicum]
MGGSLWFYLSDSLLTLHYSGFFAIGGSFLLLAEASSRPEACWTFHFAIGGVCAIFLSHFYLLPFLLFPLLVPELLQLLKLPLPPSKPAMAKSMKNNDSQPPATQPSNASVSVKEAAKPTVITKVGSLDFHGFVFDLEASPFAAKNNTNTTLTSNIPDPRLEGALPDNIDKTEVAGVKKTYFAGLFSNNPKLTDDNRLTKFAVEDETL